MRNILSQFSSTPKVEIDDPMEGQQTQDAEMVSADAVPTEPEQVPYVPAASRTTKTKAAKKDKDEVVTVKKAKKRKAEVVPPAPEATSQWRKGQGQEEGGQGGGDTRFRLQSRAEPVRYLCTRKHDWQDQETEKAQEA
jgi:hypothetical protein